MAPLSHRPVGVLAVQGDFAAHERALHRAGVATRAVRRSEHLAGICGLVLPGGETTSMLRLLRIQALERPLGEAVRSGMPVLATCAGLILLAAAVENPPQPSLGALDVDVVRNAYGRQVHSATLPLTSEQLPAGTTAVFIRAPRITRVGPAVDVLARRDGDPVLVRQGGIVGACFHPELQLDHPVTAMFVSMLAATGVAGAAP